MKSFKVMFDEFAENLTEEMVVTEDNNDEKHQSQIKSKPDLTPEKALRKKGVKIKLVTPTHFGTEIVLAKQYDEKQIKNILKDFNIKIKHNSIFVADD